MGKKWWEDFPPSALLRLRQDFSAARRRSPRKFALLLADCKKGWLKYHAREPLDDAVDLCYLARAREPRWLRKALHDAPPRKRGVRHDFLRDETLFNWVQDCRNQGMRLGKEALPHVIGHLNHHDIFSGTPLEQPKDKLTENGLLKAYKRHLKRKYVPKFDLGLPRL